MTEQMMQEIIDNWNSWKYDIIDCNASTWNTRDNSQLEMIDDWIEETSQPYETIFSERHDGIYIVDKDWEKKI